MSKGFNGFYLISNYLDDYKFLKRSSLVLYFQKAFLQQLKLLKCK